MLSKGNYYCEYINIKGSLTIMQCEQPISQEKECASSAHPLFLHPKAFRYIVIEFSIPYHIN